MRTGSPASMAGRGVLSRSFLTRFASSSDERIAASSFGSPGVGTPQYP